jgi:hypothetical protein
MYLRLKDSQGVVSLVNLAQAKYIQPAQTESGEPAVKIVWSHDTFTDHDEDDLPDETCTYSEQLYVDVTVGQIEGFLRTIGAAFIPKPTENGANKTKKAPAEPVEEEVDKFAEEEPTDEEEKQDLIDFKKNEERNKEKPKEKTDDSVLDYTEHEDIIEKPAPPTGKKKRGRPSKN